MESTGNSCPLIEFLKDRVYLGAYDYTPPDTDKVVNFTIDDALPYNNFHHDFGPLHIGHMYRFAVILHEILGEDQNQDKAVVFYSSTDPRARANAAAVLCCYMVLIQGWPAHLVLAPIAQADPPFMPFRDAGYATADFILTIQDVVYGVWRAKEKKLFDMKSFNLEEYENYERVDQGDLNEIPPNFVAFASPEQKDGSKRLNYSFLSVLDYFETHNVQLVVRLNSHLYDKTEFEKRGIKHMDLVFDDGTCPTMLFVQAFIGAAESVIAKKGKIAVHCKAGLGRTGCLIGAHLIYTYGFTAAEAIAYMRFLRPGMVVGPQQHWLYLHHDEFRDWKRTMVISKRPDPSLAGFSPLVPVDSIDARSSNDSSSTTPKVTPPRTPERSILASVDNTVSALPVPTPGQPRKASPSPAGDRHRSPQHWKRHVSEKASAQKATYEDTICDDDDNKQSSWTSNSDDEREEQQFLPVNVSPQRTSPSNKLNASDQMIVARKLRSVSNPGVAARARTRSGYQLSMTTTTTTTTTTTVSSPEARANRLGHGVRKVSNKCYK